MLFYVNTGETSSSSIEEHDDWSESVGVERQSINVYSEYDYYIIEFSPENHPKREVINSVSNRQDLPDGVGYVRVEDEAKEWLHSWYNIDEYDSRQPILVITDRPPKDYNGEPRIRFNLGNVSEDTITNLILTIYSHLEDDEFTRLRWREKFERLRQNLPESLSTVNTGVSIISLMTPP
jgi:hypothetical protein